MIILVRKNKASFKLAGLIFLIMGFTPYFNFIPIFNDRENLLDYL